MVLLPPYKVSARNRCADFVSLKNIKHGGRQIDGAIGCLDVLPEIVAAVKGKITIGFDGGIRSGADM